MNTIIPSEAEPTLDSMPDFTFAFNDTNFSDMILKIEIVPDTDNEDDCTIISDWPDDADACSIISDWPPNLKPRKRKRKDVLKETGDEATKSNNSSSNKDKDESIVIQTKTLHIARPILAEKSPFFYKLFSNGMKESEQSHVTLRIHASEEAALMELLNFMYTNTLKIKAPSALVDILKTAEKYEVVSCMSYCTKLLLNSPMTCELALFYLGLPSISTFTPLINTAKHFLANRFKDLTKYEEEVLNFSIAGFEAVLSSDDLQVSSENYVYDFVLKWARLNYSIKEERQNILSTRLGDLIRFPYMTAKKLVSVLTTEDFTPQFIDKNILDALYIKAEDPYQQRILAAKAKSSDRRFLERAYKSKPIKVMEYESPFPQCVVSFDLKKEECANLFPSNKVSSKVFHLGAYGFTLYASCNSNQQGTRHHFGFFLSPEDDQSKSLVIDYEFATRKNTASKKFETFHRGTYTYDVSKASVIGYVSGISWHDFMADNSIYFINGVLHLRAELMIKQ